MRIFPPGSGIDHGVGGAGADFVHHRFAAEDPAVPAPVGFGRREDHPAGARDRFDQGVVLARRRRLGELDVDRDRLGAGFAQAVDHPGVQRAGEGPLHAQFAEGAVVDLDDRDVAGRWLGATDREAGVDGLQLESAHQVGGVGDDRDRGGADDDEEERQFAAAAQRAGGLHSETAAAEPSAGQRSSTTARASWWLRRCPVTASRNWSRSSASRRVSTGRAHGRRAGDVVQQGDLAERFARALVAPEGPVFEDLDLALPR